MPASVAVTFFARFLLSVPTTLVAEAHVHAIVVVPCPHTPATHEIVVVIVVECLNIASIVLVTPMSKRNSANEMNAVTVLAKILP